MKSRNFPGKKKEFNSERELDNDYNLVFYYIFIKLEKDGPSHPEPFDMIPINTTLKSNNLSPFILVKKKTDFENINNPGLLL